MFRENLIFKKLLWLALTMFVAIMVTTGAGTYVLYKTSISEQAQRLTETARSNARILEAISEYDQRHQHQHHNETLTSPIEMIKTAHETFKFGLSGEFTLAEKIGDQIVFLLRNHQYGMDIPAPISLSNTKAAEPMRRALKGESGSMIGNDYRGVSVLAAYEPVKILNYGIVAKIDMEEIQTPYFRALLVTVAIAVLVGAIAILIFYRLGIQIGDKFKDSTQQFNRLASNAADMIFRMSIPDGKFEYVNEAATELLELTPEQLYKAPKHFTALLHPDSRNVYQSNWDKLSNGEALSTCDYKIITDSGRTKWILQHNVLITDSKGQPAAIECIASDITEQKENSATLKHSLIGTILAISKAVEARDPYTAGHQQRVSNLSRSIAQELGLESEQVEGVRLGAIIHDIGKIHLPAEILTKPGKLTEIEFSLIKSHPESGSQILSGVEFPWPIANIVYQHHERIDGSGYPQGLKSDEICLEAKIVAVADVVEAITSHRPYRPGLGLDIALDEIKKNRGRLYDKACVDACLTLFTEKGFTFQ